MSERQSARTRLRPLSLVGTISLLIAAGLIFAYVRVKRYHNHIPPAVHRLIWAIIVCSLIVGLCTMLAPYLPARWKRWWPGVGRTRVAIPREGLGFLLIMGVLFVGASLTQSNTLLLVFAAMAGPFVVNGSVAYTMLKNVRVQRQTPARAMAGELFSVQVDLQNPMSMMSVWMMIVQDQVAIDQESRNPTVLFTRVSPKTTQSGHYQLQLFQRGRHDFGPLRVISRFPLGLIERGNLFRAPAQMLIYPRIGRLSPRWKRRLVGASELIETPQPRSGVFEDEFQHLREYRTGDNPRAIHWRSSARRNVLIVRQYQQNREHHLLLVIDLWSSGGAEAAMVVEQALSLAATICCEHRRVCRGARLTVLACGRDDWKWEARANSTVLENLLDRLAVIEPAASPHLYQRLSETAVQITHNTRTVVVSTRSESQALANQTGTPVLPKNLPPWQWVSVRDLKFSDLVHFSEDHSSEEIAQTAGSRSVSPEKEPV